MLLLCHLSAHNKALCLFRPPTSMHVIGKVSSHVPYNSQRSTAHEASSCLTYFLGLNPVFGVFQVASPLEFYDIWVARDSDGQQFLKRSPFVTDPYSLQRIRAGLPFPVKCCWNGLVVMRSTPFVQQKLRMRYRSMCYSMCHSPMSATLHIPVFPLWAVPDQEASTLLLLLFCQPFLTLLRQGFVRAFMW